ncbi:MAG: hypothetical protein BAA04_03945 [Firmicutes bacterium ZCTH02-B6]|nr:MAG: hypothetical protein BAA04_03945 [Firmicutes bacterium ZCTH02-B6]
MEKRLYRSRTDRILGGVCGGLGRYFDIDPTLVRLAWLVMSLWAGAGVLLYVLAWVLIPREPHEGWYDDEMGPRRSGNGNGSGQGLGRLLGWLLVILGGIVFLRIIGGVLLWVFHPGVLAALLLIAAGLFLLGKRGHNSRVR